MSGRRRLSDPTLGKRKQVEQVASALGHQLNRWRGDIGHRQAYCAKCRLGISVKSGVGAIECDGPLFGAMRREEPCSKMHLTHYPGARPA